MLVVLRRKYRLFADIFFGTIFGKQVSERRKGPSHGCGIGGEFKANSAIPGNRLAVIDPIPAQGFRNPVGKGVAREETFPVRQRIWVFIAADRTQGKGRGQGLTLHGLFPASV